jgi:transcription antitermination factor NusG
MVPADEKVFSLQNAQLPLSVATLRAASVSHWYAIHTRAKHEKRVAAELRDKGIETFVPVSREVHRWSDRSRVLDIPMFPCYAFVSAVITPTVQVTVLEHPSVLRWIGFQGRPSPIPREEIASIQAVVRSGVQVGAHAFVAVGDRVRIRGGSLDGVEGVLIGNEDERKLIVSVEMVGQSVAVSLKNYEVELAARISA